MYSCFHVLASQIAYAKKIVRRQGLQELVDFRLADYADTKFKKGSFTVVWGLESVVHAEDKQAVIKEAFRVLQPGGRVIIAEYLLTKSALEPQQKAELQQWLKGWAMPGLLTEGEYKSLMLQAGFTDFTIRDWTNQVQPSFNRLARLIKLFKPIAPVLRILGLVNQGQLDNLAASEAQMKLLAQRVWRYKVIVAKKP